MSIITDKAALENVVERARLLTKRGRMPKGLTGREKDDLKTIVRLYDFHDDVGQDLFQRVGFILGRHEK